MSKTTCWNVFGEAIATSNIIFGLSWNVWSCSGCGKFSLKHILSHRSCSRLRVWAESSEVAVTCIWHHVLMPQLYKIHWFQETTSTAIFSLFHVHILRVGTIILITWGTKCIPFIIFKKGEKITKTEYNHCLKRCYGLLVFIYKCLFRFWLLLSALPIFYIYISLPLKLQTSLYWPKTKK